MSYLGDPIVFLLAVLAAILPPIDALVNLHWNKVHGITEVNQK